MASAKRRRARAKPVRAWAVAEYDQIQLWSVLETLPWLREHVEEAKDYLRHIDRRLVRVEIREVAPRRRKA